MPRAVEAVQIVQCARKRNVSLSAKIKKYFLEIPSYLGKAPLELTSAASPTLL
jgi:hypothetical protein